MNIDNASMLANAYNNWSERTEKQVAYPRATIEKYSFDMLKERGYTIVAVEDVPAKQLWNAMIEYRETTDWSAFSVADFEAALDEIN